MDTSVVAGRAWGQSGHSPAGCLVQVGDVAVGMHHEKVLNVMGGGAGRGGRGGTGQLRAGRELPGVNWPALIRGPADFVFGAPRKSGIIMVIFKFEAGLLWLNSELVNSG